MRATVLAIFILGLLVITSLKANAVTIGASPQNSVDFRGYEASKVVQYLLNKGYLTSKYGAQLFVEGDVVAKVDKPSGVDLAKVDLDYVLIRGRYSDLKKIQQELLLNVKNIRKLSLNSEPNSESEDETNSESGSSEGYDLPDMEKRDPLSDILVNLDASNGMSITNALNLLSNISGISIIYDPYTFDEPTGSRRPPKGSLGGGSQSQSDAGFRDSGTFNPGVRIDTAAPAVFGNFKDIPFTQALDIIVTGNNLKWIVKPSDNPNAKPIIYITNRERLEQEIRGTNIVFPYQLFYADPNRVTALLDAFDALPSRTQGWYIYSHGNSTSGGSTGGGSGNGSGGSGGFGGSSGSGGSGGFGGGMSGKSSAPYYFAPPEVMNGLSIWNAKGESIKLWERSLRTLLFSESSNPEAVLKLNFSNKSIFNNETNSLTGLIGELAK